MGKRFFTKKLRKRFFAGAVAAALSISMITMPATTALASSDIDLSAYVSMSGTSETATAYGSGNPSASVLISLPANMDERSELQSLGVGKLHVNLSASAFTSCGDDVGALLFFQDNVDYGWNDGKSWTALSKNGSIDLTLDMTSVNWGSASKVGKLGIQFTNLAAGSTVSYTINSIYFDATGDYSGGNSSSGEVDYGDIENNYAKLLQYSLYFYDANMCGTGVNETSLVDWRGDCHTGDKATYTRSDGSTVEVDLTGGFHDAGDHVKFGLPQAYAAFVLGMSYDTDKAAYTMAGQEGHLKSISQYFADYLVKCTVLSADKTTVEAFCCQVGQGGSGYDHGYWGAPENQGNGNRPIFFTGADDPSTDIVCLSAAALAMHYKNFGGDQYLDTAKKLFDYADKNNKAVNKSATGFYNSKAWEDDYCLAALMLYQLTKDETYRTKFNALSSNENAQKGYWPLGWDNVGPAVAYYNNNSAPLNAVMNLGDGTTLADGYRCLSDWGSARYNTSMQYIGLLYDDLNHSNQYEAWAKQQMSHILGNNSLHTCFVVGYNSLSAKYPHHRAASGYTGGDKGQTAQAHVLLGALVGGPMTNGTYEDSASNYTCNEVAIDYNVTLVAAAAALYRRNCTDKATQYLDGGYYHVGETAPVGPETTPDNPDDDKTTATSEDDKSTEATEGDQSTATTEATEGDQSTATTEATEGDQSTATTEATEGDQSTATTEATETDQPTATTEATEGDQPTATTEATEATEGDQPTATTEATETDQPTEAGKTTESATTETPAKPAVKLSKPVIKKVANTATGTKITWGKVANAKRYDIYRKIGSGKAKKIASVKSGTSYVDKKAKSNGKVYYYSVRAVNGSKYAASKYAKTVYVSRPTISSAKSKSSKKMTVTWKKINKASGYQIRYSLNKNLSKAKTVTVKGGSKKTKTISSLKKGKKYYVQIRAYRRVKGKNYYSDWSKKKVVKVKK
ncbi:MAG: glycoside hydrolase family 9 protein [Clostridium sp.]|nr:glycoside hydrolase family 9 protein [Clostridium sp.]MCM1399490.1 glycoside hydrolase family 9 protein [Clostridium sp.]MCM1460044.1 glycoside hydrolase family 9 protein [Bacteroides sp.]